MTRARPIRTPPGQGAARILFDPRNLSVKLAGVAGARLVRGRGKDVGGAGNGDCVLLDFALGLFAVADGTERNTPASRAFLLGLDRAARVRARRSGTLGGRDLVEIAEGLMARMDDGDRTTYTCALLDRGRLTYAHGGDSCLFVADLGLGEIRLATRSNLGFAGRVKSVHDAGEIETGKRTRVILATDGVWSLRCASHGSVGETLLEGLREAPIEDALDALVERHHPARRDRPPPAFDDLGAIAIDPSRWRGLPASLLLGGTSARDEERYRLSLAAQAGEVRPGDARSGASQRPFRITRRSTFVFPPAAR